MKRSICMILILVLLASLAACGGQEKAGQGELEQLTESQAASTAEEESGGGVVEDGQNPVMNFIGEYQWERAHALVEADGMENVKITITWGSSYDSLRQWEIKGYFDTETLIVEYHDAVVKDITYNEDGTVKSEEIILEGGSGSVAFRENGGFVWNDETVEGQEMEFTWAFPSTEN